MSSPIHNYPDLIATRLKNLPVDKQKQVLDFVELLAQKTTPEKTNAQRVPDLHQGKIWISEDFNEPLDDDFWLGEK